MITKWLLPLIIMFSAATATTAAAQSNSVPIRAGEHSTYSRLVIPMANDLAWELRTSGRQTTLVVPSEETAFTTDRIFDRIPRTRLLDINTNIAGGETRIEMRLGCDCSVTANIEGRNIILDIGDKAAPPQEASVEQASQDKENEEPLRPKPRPDDQVKTENAENRTTGEDRAFDLAEQLISQLNKAAEQGIIELNETDTKQQDQSELTETANSEAPPMINEVETAEELLQPVEETLDGLEAVAERIEQELAELSTTTEIGSSVRITIPEELIEQQDAKPALKQPKDVKEAEQKVANYCIDAELLDVAYWADERPYSEQVVTLQSQVFGEFDEPNPDAVLQLVRFYLYFGLGTEAKSILSDLEVDQFQTELLMEIANTVEGKPHQPGGHLDKAAGCSGPVALWRAAAIDEGEKQPISDYTEIIDIFSEYPIYVRRIIGPRLIQSFLTRRQHTAASLVFAIVERAAGYHGDAHELRRADLQLLRGEYEEAEENYWRLVHHNSEVSAVAASSLVRSMLDRGAQVPRNVTSVVDAMAFELRGSEQGADLLLAAITAKAGSNRIADALKIARDETMVNPDNAEAYFDAINAILQGAKAGEMGTLDYANMIFENLDLVVSDKVTDEIKVAIADEIMKIGLPNTALEILATLSTPNQPETRPIIAEASLKLRDLDSVLKLWQDSANDPEIANYASRSHSALGQHLAAIEVVEDNAEQAEKARLAWRAGKWDAAARTDEFSLQVLSQYMLERSSANPTRGAVDLSSTEDAVARTIPVGDELTLEYAKDLTQQSTVIRDFLQSVIGEM